MKKTIIVISILLFLSMPAFVPNKANAQVTDEGDGGLIINTVTQTIQLEDFADIFEETVDEHIANVFGVGTVFDADNNPVALFNRDTSGPGADATNLIDQMILDLTNDVFGVPGDTASFLTYSSLRGTFSEVLFSEFIQTLDGSTTTTENTTTVEVSPDAVVIGDLAGDPFLLTILAGTVTVTNTTIDTMTNFFTNIQTDFLLLTDTYDAFATRVLLAPDDSQTNSVPEPGTLMLLGSGMAGIFFFRKKFKK